MTIPKVVKEYAKTLAAFVAGVVTTMVVNLVQGGAVWPQTKAEWMQYVLTSVGAALAVSITRNKITQAQLDKDKNVIGGVVVPDAQIPVAPPVTPPPVAPYVPPVTGEYVNPFDQRP